MGKVSNPYSFNPKQNHIISSELNFDYNFSIIVAKSKYGSVGYTKNQHGTLIINSNSKFSQLYHFTTTSTSGTNRLMIMGNDSNNKTFGYACKIILPTGYIATSSAAGYCYDNNLINYLNNNIGNQIYLRLE